MSRMCWSIPKSPPSADRIGKKPATVFVPHDPARPPCRARQDLGRCGELSVRPASSIEATSRAMMTTRHLGEGGPHRGVASTARELINKSDNERLGVLSTAMSFLGLYRDPVVAQATRRCDWRIAHLAEDHRPATLYLVVPPSDISRTKPLIRLVLNQIGRRLTEELHPKNRRHRVLLMLDEFPALGRLDFFESALAFIAGYGLKAFLIGSASDTRLAVRSSLVAKLIRIWQLSRIELFLFCPLASLSQIEKVWRPKCAP